MKKILLLLISLNSLSSFSQQEDAWLFLKNKPNSQTFLANPLSILSQRAIDRRNKLQISIDELDAPIDSNYYNQIKNESTITILGKSKWLNAIHIQGTVAEIQNLKNNFSFINRIEFANKNINNNGKQTQKKVVVHHYKKFQKSQKDFTYGATSNQIKMLNGDYLHAQGFTGKNQVIAVIDAGFPNVNTLLAFKRLRDNNQILGGYDFVDKTENFYTGHRHGTNVLSTIGGYIENEFVGTAPDASFYLFRTENAAVEVPLEETLWVAAAEKADSLGVDVINTSLGYSIFDNPNYNYTYEDMDGKTTFISRGAEIAANKGILVVNSAGNSGNSSWKYITAPADAPSVITVGAVDASKNIATFSSFGPTKDGRVKPEILAQGVNAAIINDSNGLIVGANGTSFSSPIMAGLIACLNDNDGFLLKPTSNSKAKSTIKNFNHYLKKAVYESADKYSNPTNQYGYGIPNFKTALNNYIASASVTKSFLETIKVSPNPTETSFYIDGIGDLKNYKVQLFDVLGKQVYVQSKLTSKSIDISFLEKGIYILKVLKGNRYKTLKILKN